MSADMDNKIVLRRELKLHHLISLGVGGLIGSGIFVSPVGILIHVGSLASSLFLWVICGICQLLIALCYSELGCRISQSGSDYSYYQVVYGGWVASMRLWSHLILYILVQCVFMTVFARYVFEPLFYNCEIPYILAILGFLLCLGFITAVNSFSVRLAAWLQVMFTTAKLLALSLIIVLGIMHLCKGNLGQLGEPFEGSSYNPADYVLALYSGNWALSGWEYVSCVVGEIKNPKRDLCLSLIISLAIVTGVYILANIAYASLLTKEEMLASPAVAVAFAEKTMGPAAFLMSLFVAVSVLGSSMGFAMASSRIVLMGAKNNHMPAVLGMISRNWRTPVPCLIFLSFLQLVGLCWQEVFYFMELVGFQLLLYQLLSVSALIWLRKKVPNPSRVVKAPFAVPEVAIIILCTFIIITFYQRPLESTVVVVVQVLLYTFLYLACVWWKTKPQKYFFLRDAVTKMIQRILLVVPEDVSDPV